VGVPPLREGRALHQELTALGLGLLWGGYLLFTYGYVMVRGYPLTISDLALPTHRAAALAAIQAGPQKNATPGTTPAQVGATAGQGLKPGQSKTVTPKSTGIPSKVTKNKGGTVTITPQ
jgi:hypothetical protein